MIWTKLLLWYLVDSSGIPSSAPVTSECIPYRDVCYSTNSNAGIRKKRDDSFAWENGNKKSGSGGSGVRDPSNFAEFPATKQPPAPSNLINKRLFENTFAYNPISTRMPVNEFGKKLVNEAKDMKSNQKLEFYIQQWMGFAKSLERDLKGYESVKMKILYIQTIEDIEDTFPNETDDDFETKKVSWNTDILKKKVSYDYKEEWRRQKWLHYAKNPPNDMMKKIVQQAKSIGLDEEKLAFGIAKAHRRLSEDIHKRKAAVLNIEDPVKYFFSESVVKSLKVILKEADIIEEYLPKIP